MFYIGSMILYQYLKQSIVIFSMALVVPVSSTGQNYGQRDAKAITTLIDHYTLSRDTKDSTLLKSILTDDIDQLVSSGEWRIGVEVAVKGMMRSSESNPGSRKIIIDKIKYLTNSAAVVDARYEIQNADGSIRKMWSTFIVVSEKRHWRISAIRNMLPAGS